MNVYPFIEAEKAQQRNVKRACELLEVSRAAYYANCADSPSTNAREKLATMPWFLHRRSLASFWTPTTFN